jgi:hypothetical protein
MRWTRQRRARHVIAGRVLSPVSDQRHADERRQSVRRKRVVPTPQRLASSLAEARKARPGRRAGFREATEARKPDTPGRARYRPLKPLRREGRSVSAEPVCSCAHVLHNFAHGTAGAARTRSSLRPLIGGPKESSSKPRAHRAARSRNRIPTRHCEEPLRRSNPFFLYDLLCHAMDCFAYARNDGFDTLWIIRKAPGLTFAITVAISTPPGIASGLLAF